jgi:putative spermidine/putrescine transport system permease protein
VFVTSRGFFITPALLGGPGEYLMAQSIQSYVQVRANFGIASTEATILLVLVGGLLLIFRGPMGASFEAEDGAARWQHGKTGSRSANQFLAAFGSAIRSVPLVAAVSRRLADLISRIRRPVLAIHTGLVVFYLVLPMAIIIPLAFSSAPFLVFPPPGISMRWFHSYFVSSAWIHSTWFSLGIACASAILATILGILAAFPMVRGNLPGASVIYLLYLSPLIIPAMVPAVAIFFAAAPAGLIGTPTAFVAAYTVLGLPYIIVVVTTALRRFDRSLERAAASMGASPLRVLFTVTLPLIAPAILSGFLFAFLTAWGELVFALFLAGPDATPLPIQMWSDIRMEISPRIAAVSVLSFAVALMAAAAPTVFVRRHPGAAASSLPHLDRV